MTQVMPMRYCIVPPDLAHVAPLVEGAWSEGTVVVERRTGDRRYGTERRARPEGSVAAISTPADMRQAPMPDGRRVGERRAVTIPAPAPDIDLPRRARRHAERLQWTEALPASQQVRRDQEVARAVLRIQEGDTSAVQEIYEAYVDPAYRYLKFALGDGEKLEVVLGGLFSRALEAARDMDPRPGSFRRWLGDELRQATLRSSVPSFAVDDSEAPDRDTEREEEALDWVADKDLAFFIRRLPSPEREVLLLRDVVGLDLREIADLLSHSPETARDLYGQGLALLGERLVALNRETTGTRERLHMRSARRPNRVLMGRRSALAGFGT